MSEVKVRLSGEGEEPKDTDHNHFTTVVLDDFKGRPVIQKE